MSHQKIALAAVAHPDDIEFMMAGTMLRLRQEGWEIHFWNLANGCYGSMETGPEETARIRHQEAAASAALADAKFHDPLFNDMSVFYDRESLAAVASGIRKIAPSLILTHSPQDYMEDHQNVCRLVVSGAFAKGIPNFPVTPPKEAAFGPVRIYHALPHGLRDGLGRQFTPDLFVEIGGVLEKKRELLACHVSQKKWLDATQGMGAYLDEMERLSAEMGQLSGKAPFAEAFLRHHHLGFCPADFDPLREISIQ